MLQGSWDSGLHLASRRTASSSRGSSLARFCLQRSQLQLCGAGLTLRPFSAFPGGGLARVGEVLKAQRKHLILPGDVGRTEPFALLQIEEPKTRFKAARHQVARVDQPQLVSLIESVFEKYNPERFLRGASPQTLRLRFQRILGALKISSLPDGLSRGLDLGSLRAGGASWLLLTSEDSELVRRRGRWISHKIMEVYVQEAAAIQFLPRLEKSVRDGILAGASIFPAVVDKLHTFSKAANSGDGLEISIGCR